MPGRESLTNRPPTKAGGSGKKRVDQLDSASFADDVRVDERAHRSILVRKRKRSGSEGGGAGRGLELGILSQEQGAQPLERLRNSFTGLRIASTGRLDDRERLAAQRESERLPGVADFLEQAEAPGFELGNLERFYRKNPSGQIMWSNGLRALRTPCRDGLINRPGCATWTLNADGSSSRPYLCVLCTHNWAPGRDGSINRPGRATWTRLADAR